MLQTDIKAHQGSPCSKHSCSSFLPPTRKARLEEAPPPTPSFVTEGGREEEEERKRERGKKIEMAFWQKRERERGRRLASIFCQEGRRPTPDAVHVRGHFDVLDKLCD